MLAGNKHRTRDYIRLASLVSVVRLAGLAGSDRVVINQFKEMLAVAGNNGQLLAVFAHGIELVSESGLELLAGDVGELSFGNERLSLSTNKFLLENPRKVVPNSDKAAWVDAWCGSLMNMWNRDFVRANYPAQIDDLVDRSPDGTVAVGQTAHDRRNAYGRGQRRLRLDRCVGLGNG